MDVRLYKPTNAVLQEQLIGFCFVNKGDEIKEYVIYPNNYTSLSISDEAVVHLREGVLGVSSIEQGPTTIAYISQYNEPIKVKYSSSPVKQLILFFKPFGINHFVSTISEYIPEKLTTQFNPFKDLEPTLKCVLNIENRESQLAILELYLLSIYRPKKDMFFSKILNLIDQGVSNKDIALRSDVSVSYLEDYFEGMMGKTISAYSKINSQQDFLLNTVQRKMNQPLLFDDLFLKESDLLRCLDTSDSLEQLFDNLDFNPQRYWFVL